MFTLFIVIVLAILVAQSIVHPQPKRKFFWKYGKYARDIYAREAAEDEENR